MALTPEDLERMLTTLDEAEPRLKSSNVEERRCAFESLYKVASDLGGNAGPLVKALASGLGDADDQVRESCEFGLGHCKGEALQVAMKLLRSPSSIERASAATALGWMREYAKPASTAISELLLDGVDSVQSAAAGALGQIGDSSSSVVERLLGSIRSESPDVRGSVLHALGVLAREEEKPFDPYPHREQFVGYVSDADETVRWCAFYLCEKAGLPPEQYLKMLRGALQDESHRVVEMAMEGIRDLAAKYSCGDATQDLVGALSNRAGGVGNACEAIEAIGKDAAAATESLLEILNEKDRYHAVSAAGALWSIHRDESMIMPTILELLKNPEGGLGESICDLLVDMGSKGAEAVPSVIAALETEDWDLQWAAADALGAIARESQEVRRALEVALKHPSAIVRGAAESALDAEGGE